jgi:hypothetical protein
LGLAHRNSLGVTGTRRRSERIANKPADRKLRFP